MIGLVVLFIIFLIIISNFVVIERSSTQKVEKREYKKEDSVLSVLQVNERHTQNKDLKENKNRNNNENGVHVYINDLIENENELFGHALDFAQNYIYPKKEFRKILIEKANVKENAVVMIQTDTNEIYYLTFNEKFRVVALKKRMVTDSMNMDVSNKIKKAYATFEKNAI